MWFRVEHNRDGSVSSCEQVEGTFGNKGLVCYVDAASKPEAINKAKGYVRTFLKAQAAKRVTNKRKYERAKAEGLCKKCKTRQPVEGFVQCEHCLAVDRKYRSDRRAGISHARPEVPLNEKAELFVAARRSVKNDWRRRNRGKERSYVLRKVLDQFDELGPMRFRAWLSDEIDRLENLGAYASPEAAE